MHESRELGDAESQGKAPDSRGKPRDGLELPKTIRHDSSLDLNVSEQVSRLRREMRPLTLQGVCQNYAWGRPAESALVYKLSKRSQDLSLPYAELWFGVHPNGTSTVLSSDSSFG